MSSIESPKNPLNIGKSMSLNQKWQFYLVSLACILLAIAGGVIWERRIAEGVTWGFSVLTPIVYVSVVVFCSVLILYLIYRKGLPKQ